MSTSSKPSVAVPDVSLDSLRPPDTKSASKILAPKSVPSPKANITADSQDVQSLLSSVEVRDAKSNITGSLIEVPTLVHVLTQVFSTVLKDIQGIPKSVPSVPSIPTQASSSPAQVVLAEAVNVEVSPTSTHSPSGLDGTLNIPGPSVSKDTSPSLLSVPTAPPASSNTQSVLVQQPVAKGPPSDPSLEPALNFASRKAFHSGHFANSTQTPHTPTCAVVDMVNTAYSSATLHPSGHPNQSFVHQNTFHHQAHASVPEHTPPTYAGRTSFLAPKPTPPVPSSPHQFESSPISPKPMVSFDIAKWTKEMKDVNIDDESYDSVLSWYDFIQQAMVIATGSGTVMPEVVDLRRNFCFSTHILPHQTSSVYKAGHIEYLSMAKAIRIYILRPSTIGKSCTQLLELRDLNKEERDGFVILLNLLGGVFPHLGGPHLDVVREISSMTARKTETFDSLLQRFTNMSRKLNVAGHHIPPTALFQRYMDLVKINPHTFSLISPIHRDFHEHLIVHGPDVPFVRHTIRDVHKYIKASGIVTDSLLSSPSHVHPFRQKYAQAHQATTQLVPYAKAAQYIESFETQGPPCDDGLPDDIHPQANAAAMALNTSFHNSHRKFNSCPVCYQRHPVLKCWARGTDFQPLWLRRNIAKYNALHKDDVIDEQYKNQAPPLRHAQVSAQANKSVTFSPSTGTTTLVSTHTQYTPSPPQDVVPFTVPPQPQRSQEDDIFHDAPSAVSDIEYNQSVYAPVCNMASNDECPQQSEEMSFIEA